MIYCYLFWVFNAIGLLPSATKFVDSSIILSTAIMLTSAVSKSFRSSGFRAATRSFASTGVNSESYSEKQAKLGRPVSPHVTIYKFPITALTSITNRVTGVALSAGKFCS